MKIVAIIPIKSKSSRVKKKNFIKIKKNKPLYKFFLEKVLKCNFDQIFVDTDSIEIMNFCKKRKINIIKRKKKFSSK